MSSDIRKSLETVMRSNMLMERMKVDWNEIKDNIESIDRTLNINIMQIGKLSGKEKEILKTQILPRIDELKQLIKKDEEIDLKKTLREIKEILDYLSIKGGKKNIRNNI